MRQKANSTAKNMEGEEKFHPAHYKRLQKTAAAARSLSKSSRLAKGHQGWCLRLSDTVSPARPHQDPSVACCHFYQQDNLTEDQQRRPRVDLNPSL